MPVTRLVPLVLAVLLASPLGLGAPRVEAEDGAELRPGPIVVETTGSRVDAQTVEALAVATALLEPEPEVLFAASIQGGFGVSYDPVQSAPSSVRSVVDRAVEDWSQVLDSSEGPVITHVYWGSVHPETGQAYPSNVLGMAGPTFVVTYPGADASYPVGLGNQLSGYDLVPDHPELVVLLNSSFDWHLDPDTTPPAGRVDLFSVFLHELGHGLGFLGSPVDGVFPSSSHYVYDELVHTHDGPLLDEPSPNSFLVGGPLFAHLGSDFWLRLYTPNPWRQGSSYSHFDEGETSGGGAGALMSPFLTSGEQSQIDAAVLGVMLGLGWEPAVGLGPVTPVLDGVEAAAGAVDVDWSVELSADSGASLVPESTSIEVLRDGVLVTSSPVEAAAGSGSVSGLEVGVEYSLRLRTVANGTSAVSNSLTVLLHEPPAAPSPVSIEGSGIQQRLGWTAPGPSGTITGYEVEFRQGAGAYQPLAVLGSIITELDVSVGPQLTTFRVRAMTAHGPGHWGESPTVTSVVRPGAPIGLSARSSGHWVDVGWAPDASIERTVVFSSVDGGPWQQVGATSASGIRVLLDQAAAYRFGVRHENSAGTGPLGETSTIVNAARRLPLDGMISRLYLAYFSRPADTAGLGFWQLQMARGTGLVEVSSFYADSGEFRQQYGSLSGRQFVQQIYLNVLGRAPDAAGLAFWEARLAAGVSRGEVVVGFSESPEFVAITGSVPTTSPAEGSVSRLYRSYFQRPPDSAGLAYWQERLTSGRTLGQISGDFAASVEFRGLYGSLSDAAFVDLVYRNVLGRPADAAGAAFWQSRLAVGVSRGEVMVGFSESAEYIVATGTAPPSGSKA